MKTLLAKTQLVVVDQLAMDDYVLALGNCERTRLLRKGIFSKSCMAQGRVEI
jgi:hypothetical protein